jgi:hypothetical protein
MFGKTNLKQSNSNLQKAPPAPEPSKKNTSVFAKSLMNYNVIRDQVESGMVAKPGAPQPAGKQVRFKID